MNLLVFALLPFLVAANDEVLVGWINREVGKKMDPTKFPLVPMKEYLKATESNHSREGSIINRCLLNYCRMADKDGCQSQCGLYGPLISPSVEAIQSEAVITYEYCFIRCTSYCTTANSCYKPCQKLCKIRYSYPDVAEYTNAVEKYDAESTKLFAVAGRELDVKFQKYAIDNIKFTDYKFNATELHLKNFVSVPNPVQNNCYLQYCRMGDKDGCRHNCATWAQDHYPFTPYTTMDKDLPECTQRCNAQCKGAVCAETCTKLCDVSFFYPNRTAYDEERLKYTQKLAEVVGSFVETVNQELKLAQ